jgi:nitroimidazol reductase NimA-like FMN-containing flavoprotein (pyridoxamine 5'-phosphate oxidase superfamily)
MIERMKNLVRENDLCVLATVSEGRPHCSLMAYVTDEGCREIYMVTLRESRKFSNLRENPLVSLLVDTRERHRGVQRQAAKALTIEGEFRRVGDVEKEAGIRRMLLARHPHLKPLLDEEDSEIVCVKISSFLLLDGVTDAHFEKVE